METSLIIILLYFSIGFLVIFYFFRSEIQKLFNKKSTGHCNSITSSTNCSGLVTIVKVFSTVDENIIRSMLESAGINTSSDSTNFQRIQFGNLTSCLYGINVSIDNDDVQEAKIIVINFIEHKKKQRESLNDTEKTKRLITKFFLAPALYLEIPELLI